MYQLGSQVVRESTGDVGTVFGYREKLPTAMIEVKWASGVRQWMPVTEVSELDKPQMPKAGPAKPAYLVALRRANPLKKSPAKIKQLAAQRLADDLASLSTRKKQRTNNKAAKMIQRFEKGILPQHMSQTLRNPQQQAEHERMEMKRNWKRNHKFTKEEKRAYAKAKALSRKLDAQMKGAIARDCRPIKDIVVIPPPTT